MTYVRNWLASAFALLLAIPAGAEPLNVVFVVADDLGWADIGPNNPDCFYDTPALDRLAETGANFSQGYATSPVCSPSRVSLMTGRYPVHTANTSWFHTKRLRNARFRTAEYDNQLPLEETTIAQVLKGSGYRTFFAGKWHLGHDEERWPDRRGFDINVGGCGRGSPSKAGFFAPYDTNLPGLQGAPDGEHLPARLTDEAIRFIESAEGPFFVTLNYYSVHTPLDGREDLVEKYARRATRLGYTEQERFGEEEQVWDAARQKRPTRPVRERQDHAVYAAMVEAMDEHIGRLLDAIEELGFAENTLIVFTSDNGGLSSAEGSPTSNLPLRGGKGWMYEGGIRVPLIIRWPGVTEPGTTIPTPATGCDLFDTIADAAGLDVDAVAAHTDGSTLREALTSAEPLERGPLFWHYPHYANQGGRPAAAIRKGDWKLIQRLDTGAVQLFDLSQDLAERDDLSEHRRQLAVTLAASLQAWQERSGAKFLRPHPQRPEVMPWLPPYLCE